MTVLLNAAGGITASTSILIIFLIVTVFGALKGLMRGIGRQTVRTLTIIASLIISIALTASISTDLNASLAGKTVEDMLEGASISISSPELEELILNLDAETARIIIAVPAAVVALPIIFTILFVLISAIGELVHIVISMILRLKMSKNNAATRFLGLILGALQGASVAGILLFPFGCFTNLSDGMMASIKDGGIKEGSSVEQSCESLDAYFAETKDNTILNLVMRLGGNKLQDKLSSVMIDGIEADARDPFYVLAGIFGDWSYLEECDFKAPTKEEQAVIDEIAKKLTRDGYTANVISGVLREVAAATEDGRLDTLVSNDTLPDPYRELFKDMLTIFDDSNVGSIEDDVLTVLDVYYQLADAGTLTALAEGSDSVADTLIKKPDNTNTVISSVIDTLEENENTKPLVNTLAKLSVTVMADSLGTDADSAQMYDNVKGRLKDIADIPKGKSDDEYKTAVSNIISTTLTESGITEVSTDIVSEMAQYVTDNFKDSDIFEDEDIDSIILSYFDAYLNSVEQ